MTASRTIASRTIPSRSGRPRREQAGEVERRLLDAALQVFLARGYEGASCEEVAALAGAGKASLYARFANKEALFAAVIRRRLDAPPAPEIESDPTLPLAERLRRSGLALLHHALSPETLATTRLVIAAASRFPDLAGAVGRAGRAAAVAQVRRALLAGDDRPADPDRIAESFVDLVLAPHQLRALLGEDAERLRAGARQRVEDALALALTPSRQVGSRALRP